MRRVFGFFIVVFAFISQLNYVNAAELPYFRYIAGSQNGNKIGDVVKIPSDYTYVVIKQWKECTTPIPNPKSNINFCMYNLKGKDYTLGGSPGGDVEEIWETDITDFAKAPRLLRRNNFTLSGKAVAVEFNFLDGAIKRQEGKDYKISYKIIDEAADSKEIAGFYINNDKAYIDGSFPTGMTFCQNADAGVLNLDNIGKNKPVYCSELPSSTNKMVVDDSFTIPYIKLIAGKDYYVHLISGESIGLAAEASELVVSDPPKKFAGHLWKMDSSEVIPRICTKPDLYNDSRCILSADDFEGDVKITIENSSGEPLKTISYNGSSFDFGDVYGISSSDSVKICVDPPAINSSDSGVYIRFRDRINGRILYYGTEENADANISKRCSNSFNPVASNKLYLGFLYKPELTVINPWYTVTEGDIFAGGSILHNGWDNVTPATGFTKYIANTSGSLMANIDTIIEGSNSDNYTQSGIRAIKVLNNETDTISLDGFPESTAKKPTWKTAMPSGIEFTNSVYYVNLTQFSNWLRDYGTYSVANPKNPLAVVYVTGTGSLKISKELKSVGNSKLLIVTSPDIIVEFVGGGTFGSLSPSKSSSNFDAALVSYSENQLNISTESTSDDLTLSIKGLIANNDSVLLGRNRGDNNEKYPSTNVIFDPAYLWLLSNLDSDIFNSSGLTHYKIKWEVLD